MEAKAPTSSLTTYRELPLDLSVAPGGSLVHIQLPTSSTFGRTSRLTRQVLSDYPKATKVRGGEDAPAENVNKRRIADSSGLLFRAEGRYPRNVLWRSVDGGSTLELRSVDLSKSSGEDREAGVVLQLTFPHALRKNCVGLVDAEHGDSVDVFALTKNNDLYTFSIRSSFFCQSAASEEELDRWCWSARPSVLSLAQAFRLTSCASNRLVFSLGDGRLVQLTRRPGADGHSWTETVFADGNWGPSLRGLISWQGQNKIRYEGTTLAHGTALAAQPSPDGKHIISVTLDHALRIWSTETGKPTLTRDLLDGERDQSTASKVLLDPSLSQVLALESGVRVAFSGDKYYLITFSPHEGGSFKIWGVRDADFGGDGVRDIFPEETLRVPDPDDGALWTLADFRIAGHPSTDQISVWAMLRLNKRYQLFHKVFPGLASLAQEWNTDWERTAIDTLTSSAKFDAALQEPHGLALDVQQEMPWILSAVAISPVRTCTETESLVYNNPNSFLHSSQSVAQSIEGGTAPAHSETATIVDAAAQFRVGLDQGPVEEAIRTELWQDPSVPAPQRMQIFYENAGFSQVPDREFNELLGAIDRLGGPDTLTTELFFAVLETFPEQISQGSRLVSTSFGRRALVTGATELIELQERIVSDLLCTVVFIDQDVERTESAASAFNAPRVFEELVSQLRLVQVMKWIALNSKMEDGREVSILENNFAGDIRPQAAQHQSGCAALSGTVRDLIKWVGGGNDPSITVEQIAVNIQCSLLASGDVSLATAFLRFQPTTAWATYVRARHSLLCRDFVSAAVYFKKAAYKLSRNEPPSSFYGAASAGLIKPLETSHLASGVCNYYTHIAHLFSAPKISAHVQIVQFASLALQHFPRANAPEKSASLQSHRSDLLTRLFWASLALDDYDTTFSALVRYTDKGLRKAALKSLVTTMLDAGAASELVGLPFSGPLKPEVDALLTEMVRSEAGASSSRTSLSANTKAVKVLYAWKVRQGDYRGAAACIVERLHAQQSSGRFKAKKQQRRAPQTRSATASAAAGPGGRGSSNASGASDDPVLDEYLIAINALSMVGGEVGVDAAENEGWVFVDNTTNTSNDDTTNNDDDDDDNSHVDDNGSKNPSSGTSGLSTGRTRILVRLRDLRREYQREMDVRDKWERGRFALTDGIMTGGDDYEDEDEEGEREGERAGDAMEM